MSISRKKRPRPQQRSPLIAIIIGVLILIIFPILILYFRQRQQVQGLASGTVPFLYASIDTMKETKDTGNNQLTDAQIAADVIQYANLNNNYIAISVPYDFSDYFGRWVSAIRKTGKHIWFRSHWNQWENDYNTTGTMLPSTYLANLDSFIRTHPTYFQTGDIFDGCAECENGKYFSTWPGGWEVNATAQGQFNQLLINLTNTEDAAFQAIGISGIDTRVHSTDGWIAQHTYLLYPSTAQYMGKVTTDSYLGEATNVTPASAASAEKTELDAIYAAQNVPVILGEYGYSTAGFISDAQQEQVLQAVFQMLQTLPYLQGLNYWVGYGGTTAIFNGNIGALTYRPAATDLTSFFANKFQQSPTTSPVASTSGQPTATTIPTVIPTATSVPTATVAISPTSTPTPTSIPVGTKLGGLDLGGYCASLKLGGSILKNGSWYCTNSRSKINMTNACKWQYATIYTIAKQDIPGNPYSWSCYTTSHSPTPTPTPTQNNRNN